MLLPLNPWSLAALAGVVLLLGAVGCEKRSAARNTPANAPLVAGALDDEPITPIPLQPAVALDVRKVALGRKLFHEPKLSRDNSLSCASCHPLDRGGSDNRVRSLGIDGQEGEVNTPSIFNSGLNFAQFWDGRASSLEDQVDGPIQSMIEMGSTWHEVVGKLRNSPEHTKAFKEIYRDGVQPHNVKDAIAAFERSLTTPNSRFDRFLRGERGILTEGEKAGYLKFKNYGCISCHQGTNIGANLYQRMGIIGDYFSDRGNITKADYGRFNGRPLRL